MFGCKQEDYVLKVELARCCLGLATVYLAQHTPSGKHIALKKYKLLAADKEELAMIQEELQAMRQFNQPNIQSFLACFVHSYELYLVAPLMCFGSCRDTIRNCFGTGFPEIFVALIMRDVLTALEYLHRRGYIHRAIRASHILLDQTHAVLSGFRESACFMKHGARKAKFHELAPFSRNSLNWLAPEVLEQNLVGYTESSDIYSIGLTCCELANGVEPFGDLEPTFMFTEKMRGSVPTLLDKSTYAPKEEDITEITANGGSCAGSFAARAQRIYAERVFSDEFHKFSEICMELRPEKRWTALQLLSHPFMKQCRHTSILDQSQRFGLQATDYTEIRDDSLALPEGMTDLSLGSSEEWSWDFS